MKRHNKAVPISTLKSFGFRYNRVAKHWHSPGLDLQYTPRLHTERDFAYMVCFEAVRRVRLTYNIVLTASTEYQLREALKG